MAETRIELLFSGELVPGADPRVVRERLGDLFKLSPEALDVLFSGQRVTVKRDLDAATAARYRDAFREAGAILTLSQGQTTTLSLAPPGADVGEAVPSTAPRKIDTSSLSLVPGERWTLEDCAPPVVPKPVGDLSYLTLAPAESSGPGSADVLEE